MSKNDFGFYGSGLDGYVHYKQSVDRINQSAPVSYTHLCKGLYGIGIKVIATPAHIVELVT